MGDLSQPKHAVITPAYVRMANEIIRWAEDFLVPDTVGMVRTTISGKKEPGPVCPFVAPAIENDSLYLAFHPGITGYLLEDIGAVLETYIHAFEGMRPFGTRQTLKAVLIVFPDIPPNEHRVLTVAASAYKTKFVKEGLMVAPFYPSCLDMTKHDVNLYTSRAPHPFIAIRQMAIHDILFLGDNEEWFKAYDLQFGEKFKEPDKLDAHDKPLMPLYLEAKRKYKKH